MSTELIVLVAALAHTACVPYLNRRCYAPEVAGAIIRNGVPASNAEVLLTTNFSKVTATARTDADGRFKLGPLSEMHFTKTVLGDPLYDYVIIIKVAGGEEYRGLTVHGMGNAPQELSVTCDLSQPIGKGKSLSYCSQNTSLQPAGPAAGRPGR
ncbi:MAG: carboxypeptidase-like regulatory domain-containing protein [Elusimicrobiota bacterium]